MDGTRVTSEMERLKHRLNAVWSSADFGRIATSFEAGAIQFVGRLGLSSGVSVLDVACGTGNLAIPAARKGADVTGLDIVPEFIGQARSVARAEGLGAKFDVGDAESLPYADGSFDVVMSMFGAMFAPRPDVVVDELTRVCKAGGVIAMANWTPGGFVGEMFKITGKHVPPPAGMPSPLRWGDEDTVCERFGSKVSDLVVTRRMIDFVFPFGAADVVEHFRKFYGPTLKAFETLGDDKRQAALRKDLEELWAVNNASGNGSTLVTSEYLEVKAIRA